MEEGEVLQRNHLVCVTSQMNVQLRVRAPRKRGLAWVAECGEGEVVDERTLVAVVEAVGKELLESQSGGGRGLSRLRQRVHSSRVSAGVASPV